jgi:predicted dehydrogenase
MIRLALAGYGVRGRQWARVIAAAADAELAVVVEVSERSRNEAPAPAWPTLKAALDTVAVDGVILATPPASHAEDALLALERGIPVLCEKPLTEQLDEAILLAEASRRTGVPLLVGMNFRYLPATQEYRRIVQSAELGKPMFGQFSYIRNRDGRRPDLNDFPLTMAQPMLFEQSIHHLDLLRYVYGREVVSVACDTWNPPTSVYRDDSCVAALLQFEGDLRVSYLGTWTSGSNRLEFGWRTDCADGIVVQANQFGALLSSRHDAQAALGGPLFDPTAQPLQEISLPTGEPFIQDTAHLLAHFVQVARGTERAGPSVADHLRTLALLHACVKSAGEGRRVTLERFTADHGIPMH